MPLDRYESLYNPKYIKLSLIFLLSFLFIGNATELFLLISILFNKYLVLKLFLIPKEIQGCCVK